MPRTDVGIQDHGGGMSTVTVNGVQLTGVRAVTVCKRHGDLDLVTIELVADRVSVTPRPYDADWRDDPQSVALAEIEARDAEIDARIAARTEETARA